MARRCRRTGLIVLAGMWISGAASAAEIYHLEQNWDAHDRAWFYHVSQGSRLVPYAVFLHLESVDGGQLFRASEHMRRYGYIDSQPSQYNPDNLPIGFARDGDYIGLTCAACHTAQFAYANKIIRVQGGQSGADMQSFVRDLEAALAATLNDDVRLRRFATRLVANGTQDDAKVLLQAALDERRAYNARNATELRYGYGRLDAFGAILNKGLAATGVRGNHNPPNGPTSYPYIWDTPQHDWVEWNGSSPNPLEGALSRNVGEVIGVFGEVTLERAKLLGVVDAGYPSSVRVRALRRIEKQVARLQSPVWPEDLLPRIDHELAVEGAAIFEDYCGACHLPIDRSDPARAIQVRMSSLEAIGTDAVMARNVVEYVGRSGRFEGQPRFYFAGDALGAEAPALYIVNHIMAGVLTNNPIETLLARRDARLMGHGRERHPPKYLDGKPMPAGTETTDKALLAYKARPLNGVWATAPYLHNGSVPNLYELMLPAALRSQAFHVGGWLFDPYKVGFSTLAGEQSSLLEVGAPGNSNAGHEYGTGKDGKAPLNHLGILAVVEYLKTL